MATNIAETIGTSDLAKLLMMTTQRVGQLANDGVLRRIDHGTYALVPSLHGYFRYLRIGAYGREAVQREDDFIAMVRDLEAKVRKLEAAAAK